MSILQKKFGIQKPVQQFEKRSDNGVLLLDGDSICYNVTADCKKLATALNRFETRVLELLFLTRTQNARVHLTPSGCAKNRRPLLKTVKPYQGNRKNKAKPLLLEPLRIEAARHFSEHPDFSVHLNFDVEADDALMQDTYALQNTLLYSEDKDLQIAHTPSWDIKTGRVLTLQNRFGYLEEAYTPAGQFKLKGKGTKFFLAQCIMGDTADNVQGLLRLNGKLAGAKAAQRALWDFTDESEAVSWLIEQFAAIEQNILPEAEALWLTRWKGDSALAYLQEHQLSSTAREFLDWCSAQEYYHVDEVQDEGQDEVAV